MFYEHGVSGGMLGAPQHSASCFPGTCRHESYAQFGAYMGKFDAEYWDSWVPVGSGLGSFTNLFGMNGAVTGCVRMSDCTMNSRL